MGMPHEKPKDVKGTIKRIFIYIGKNRALLFAMLAFMLAAAVLNVIAPSLQALAIDAVTVTEAHPEASITELVKWLRVSRGCGNDLFPDAFCR